MFKHIERVLFLAGALSLFGLGTSCYAASQATDEDEEFRYLEGRALHLHFACSTENSSYFQKTPVARKLENGFSFRAYLKVQEGAVPLPRVSIALFKNSCAMEDTLKSYPVSTEHLYYFLGVPKEKYDAFLFHFKIKGPTVPYITAEHYLVNRTYIKDVIEAHSYRDSMFVMTGGPSIVLAGLTLKILNPSLRCKVFVCTYSKLPDYFYDFLNKTKIPYEIGDSMATLHPTCWAEFKKLYPI